MARPRITTSQRATRLSYLKTPCLRGLGLWQRFTVDFVLSPVPVQSWQPVRETQSIPRVKLLLSKAGDEEDIQALQKVFQPLCFDYILQSVVPHSGILLSSRGLADRPVTAPCALICTTIQWNTVC